MEHEDARDKHRAPFAEYPEGVLVHGSFSLSLDTRNGYWGMHVQSVQKGLEL
jgi:hypothetical protein